MGKNTTNPIGKRTTEAVRAVMASMEEVASGWWDLGAATGGHWASQKASQDDITGILMSNDEDLDVYSLLEFASVDSDPDWTEINNFMSRLPFESSNNKRAFREGFLSGVRDVYYSCPESNNED